LKPFYKNLALWLVVGLAMILLFSLFRQSRVDDREINYTEFMGQVEKGLVAGVVIQGQEISGSDPIHQGYHHTPGSLSGTHPTAPN